METITSSYHCVGEKQTTKFIWDALMAFKARRRHVQYEKVDYDYVSNSETFKRDYVVIRYYVNGNPKRDVYEYCNGVPKFTSKKV